MHRDRIVQPEADRMLPKDCHQSSPISNPDCIDVVDVTASIGRNGWRYIRACGQSSVIPQCMIAPVLVVQIEVAELYTKDSCLDRV